MELIFKDDYSVLSGKASTGNIGYLSYHIKKIEKAVKDKIKIRKPFVYLHTVPGIGDILALTIMLEVGDISRFAKVGNFSSYCRCVFSSHTSNGKKKGSKDEQYCGGQGIE